MNALISYLHRKRYSTFSKMCFRLISIFSCLKKGKEPMFVFRYYRIYVLTYAPDSQCFRESPESTANPSSKFCLCLTISRKIWVKNRAWLRHPGFWIRQISNQCYFVNSHALQTPDDVPLVLKTLTGIALYARSLENELRRIGFHQMNFVGMLGR